MDKVQKRFDELQEMAESIDASKGIGSVRRLSPVQFSSGPTSYYNADVKKLDWGLLVEWRTSVLSLLERVFGTGASTYVEFRTRVASKNPSDRHFYFDTIYPIFKSAKEQYEGGYLFEIRNLVHAEVFSNELEQAGHFLKAGYKSPAAVTAGVVLETTLKKLCEETDGVEPADKINKMNDDLAKAGIYNKMKADQIRAWAKIRNDAAHGSPDEFDEADVSRMIEGVRDFVGNLLS